MKILLVQVRGARYAIPATNVVEIIRAVGVSPLPGAPAVVSGIINVRGKLMPVIDPAVRFGQPETPLKASDNFVLVAVPSRTVALRVDIADDLEDIDDDDIKAADSMSASATHGRLAGVATLPDGLVVIYDPAQFLDEAEKAALAEAMAEAAR